MGSDDCLFGHWRLDHVAVDAASADTRPGDTGRSCWLLALAAVISALNYTLYFKLVAQIGATKTISVEFLVTVVAVIVGTLLLGERLSLLQFAGAAIIICGCALVLDLFKPKEPDIHG